MILSLDQYKLKAKLRYFVIENIFLNDICIIEIIDLIFPNLVVKKESYNALIILSI